MFTEYFVSLACKGHKMQINAVGQILIKCLVCAELYVKFWGPIAVSVTNGLNCVVSVPS